MFEKRIPRTAGLFGYKRIEEVRDQRNFHDVSIMIFMLQQFLLRYSNQERRHVWLM